MRVPILTEEQQAEYEAVKAEAAAMAPTATPSERVAMCCKLSTYAYGTQHLNEEDIYILSRTQIRRFTSHREMEEADDLP